MDFKELKPLTFSFLAFFSAFPLGAADNQTTPNLLRKCASVLPLIVRGAPQRGAIRDPIRTVDISETIPTTVGQVGTANPKKVSTFDKITPENISSIFSNNYTPEKQPDLLGAKGILYRGVDGQWKVLMWPTGEGREGNSIHHRDAVASVLEHESELIKRVALERDSIRPLELSDELARLAKNLSEVRRGYSFPLELLGRFSGFQMTARRNPSNGRIELLSVDLDSSLTSAQITGEVNQTTESVNEMMRTIASVIDPQLKPKEYRVFKRQREILTGSDRLTAPAGSKLTDLEK